MSDFLLQDQLSPLRAASSCLVGLIFALGAIALCYFQAAFPERGLATMVDAGEGAAKETRLLAANTSI